MNNDDNEVGQPEQTSGQSNSVGIKPALAKNANHKYSESIQSDKTTINNGPPLVAQSFPADKKPLEIPAQVQAALKGEPQEITMAKAKSAQAKSDQMSAVELTKVIQSSHPTNGEESFSTLDPIGHYQICGKAHDQPVTPVCKEIGLGASMFLLQTKAVTILFLILTLVNVPVFIFFYASNETVPQVLTDYFMKLSLGNIGQAEISCTSLNYATSEDLKLSCSSNFAQLTELQFIGVAFNDDTECVTLGQTVPKKIPEMFLEGCFYGPNYSSVSIFTEEGEKNFLQKYQEDCLGKSSCTIPLNIHESNLIHESCQDILDQRQYTSRYISDIDKVKFEKEHPEFTSVTSKYPEPQIVTQARCKQDEIELPNGVKILKNEFGVLVVAFDAISIIIFIFFVRWLENKQIEYSEEYADQTIEMNDFCMRFTNLPSNKFYQGKQPILKSQLWANIQKVIINEQLEKENGNMATVVDEEQYTHILDQSENQIVDIDFAQKDIGMVKTLVKLSNIRKDIQTKYERKAKSSISKQVKIQINIDKTQAKYDSIKDEYLKSQGDTKEFIKNYRPNAKPYIYAFVTFRSMQAYQVVEELYQKYANSRYRCRVRCINKICPCFCRKEMRQIKMLEFGGQWPEPQRANQPDSIMWQNMGYSDLSRKIRTAIIYLIAFIVTLAAFGGIIFFNTASETLQDNFKTTNNCPQDITKLAAMEDVNKVKKLQQGLMHCYCLNEMINNYQEFLSITFESDVNQVRWCEIWAKSYASQKGIEIGAPIVVNVINVIVKIIFEQLSSFGREYTKNAETQSTFKKITVLQFFNLAVISMLINFKIQSKFINSFGLLDGVYDNFTEDWYQKVGTQYCMTLLINVTTPISEVVTAFIAFFKRYLDRSRQKSYVIEGTDDINTKKVLQGDVETLYTGTEIKSFIVYSQYFTALWGILVFSSGMPILYGIGFLTYFSQYWIYKYLLVKYYKKTVSFDDQLPISTIFYFRLGIFFHLIVAGFTFTNQSLISSRWNEFESIRIGDTTYSEMLETLFGDNLVLERYSYGIGILYFTFIILIIILYNLKEQLTRLLRLLGKLMLRVLCCCCYKRIQKCFSHSHDDDCLSLESQDLLSDLRLGPLQDYYNRAKQDIQDFKEILKNPDYLVDQNHEQNLKRRVKAIEDVVNCHIERLIQESTGVEASELRSLDTENKLRLLITNEKTLIKRMKRTKEPILRMKGQTQSYYMFDSRIYKQASKMNEVLKQGLDEDLNSSTQALIQKV